jgi:hypothetical protein
MSIESSIYLGISELFQHVIAALLIAVEIPLQQVGKEEQAKDGKHDKKFEQDDSPEFSAPGHVPEPIEIKSEYPFDHEWQILYMKIIKRC